MGLISRVSSRTYRSSFRCCEQMMAGKMAAQVGHASNPISSLTDLKAYRCHTLWRVQAQPKIVVAAKDKQHLYDLQDLCFEHKIPSKIIHDAGRTQIDPGSVTALRIGPYYSDEIDKVSGNLKLLNTWPHKWT